MKKIALIMLGMSLVAGSDTAHGQAGLATYAAGQSVASIIEQAKNGANEVIHNAEQEFGNGAFTARQNAEILIQQLNLMATQLEGKAFKDLSGVQKQFFINTRNSLDEMKRTARFTVQQAQQLTIQGESMLGTLPGANRTARVLDFSPRYMLAQPKGTQISISVNGSWIGSGEPTLTMSGKPCSRVQKTEAKLIFRCAMVELATSTQVEYQKLTLVTTDRPGFWDKFMGWFGSSPEKRTYELGLAVVPRTIGEFTATVKVVSTRNIEAQRAERRRADNQHCWGTRDYAWDINATSGWSIKSMPTTRLIGDSTATDEGVQAWTPSGFRFKGKAKNSGSCIRDPIFGTIIARDGRGHVEIEANWIEYQPLTEESETEVNIGNIQWGIEHSMPLPNGTTFVSLRSRMLDGSTYEDTSTDAAVRPWYSVSIDIENRRVIIRPRELDDALARG